MIDVINIKKTFNKLSKNKNEVLKGVTLKFSDSGLVAIFGKSGSGKTTLLNIMGGLESFDSGDVLINGLSIKGKEDRLRNKSIGYIFQNFYLEKNTTITDIMHNQMIIAGYNDEKLIDERTKEVLELVDMYRFKNKRSDALSGGQKQRVAIARALIKGSDIILADEPTGNLDNENTIHVMEILKKISKTKLVVLVTHEQNLIRDYADSYFSMVDGKLDESIKIDTDTTYDINSNNIYVNKENFSEYKNDNIALKLYGKTNKKASLEIYNDEDKVYLISKDNIEIIDNTSEKKIVYEKPKEKDVEIPLFKNTANKKCGRLFRFKNIVRIMKSESDEKVYSLSFIIKLIFLLGMACCIAFFVMTLFDISNQTIIQKNLDDNTLYTSLNNYSEIRKITSEKYDYVDFFETEYRNESFTFSSNLGLKTVKTDCEIRSISDIEINNLYGDKPDSGEIIISRRLANNIKKEFRISELENDNTILMMSFVGNYKIVGINDDSGLNVYFNKSDYINYLGVYNKVQFSDYSNYLLSNDYSNASFKSKIEVDDTLELKDDECMVLINRNSLYKMMKQTSDADYIVDVCNNKIKSEKKAIQLRNSKLFVNKFEIKRDISDTDVVILINSNVMKDIFINISPSIDNLENNLSSNGLNSNYYFKFKYNDSNYELLNQEFVTRGISRVDINRIYEDNLDSLKSDLYSYIYIYIFIALLLCCVFYLIEKSGSLKNSKEYGIFRAIGVNKTNLLFKEFVASLINNVVPYTIFYLIGIILIGIRYHILNINLLNYILISISGYGISILLIILISLIPYLFVLFNKPAKILARYDI